MFPVQMGSFLSDGQRYSLMTPDARKASQSSGNQPLPIKSNVTTIYFGDSKHLIEPVTHDEAEITDDSG